MFGYVLDSEDRDAASRRLLPETEMASWSFVTVGAPLNTGTVPEKSCRRLTPGFVLLPRSRPSLPETPMPGSRASSSFRFLPFPTFARFLLTDCVGAACLHPPWRSTCGKQGVSPVSAQDGFEASYKIRAVEMPQEHDVNVAHHEKKPDSIVKLVTIFAFEARGIECTGSPVSRGKRCFG